MNGFARDTQDSGLVISQFQVGLIRGTKEIAWLYKETKRQIICVCVCVCVCVCIHIKYYYYY